MAESARHRAVSSRPFALLVLLLQVSAFWGQTAKTGTEVVVPTSLGDLRLREYGTRGAPAAIGLHGSVEEEWVRHEWDDAAAALAERAGYNVFLPDLHALKHRVRHVEPEPLLGALLDVVRWAANTGKPKAEGQELDKIPLLMGKSWGGYLATQIAALPSRQVQSVVLVAPCCLPREGPPIWCEAALFCAEDDPMIKKANQLRPRLKNMRLFQREPTGGHRILTSYTPIIVDFAGGERVPAHGAAMVAEPGKALGQSSKGKNQKPQLQQSSQPDRTWMYVLFPILAAPPVCYLLMAKDPVKKEAPDKKGGSDPGKPAGGPRPQAVGAAE